MVWLRVFSTQHLNLNVLFQRLSGQNQVLASTITFSRGFQGGFPGRSHNQYSPRVAASGDEAPPSLLLSALPLSLFQLLSPLLWLLPLVPSTTPFPPPPSHYPITPPLSLCLLQASVFGINSVSPIRQCLRKNPQSVVVSPFRD